MTKAAAAFVALLATAVIAAITSLRGDALICDEVAHITAGYSYVTTGSLRLNPEHPPLAKSIAALPLLAMDLNEDAFLARFRGVAVEEQWRQGRMFLYGSGNDPVRVTRAARTTVLLVFYVTSAGLVWWWGTRRYGPGPGLLGFVVYAFSPTVLAHARFVTTDVASAATTLASMLAALACLRSPGPRRIAITSMALATALLVKYSALLLLPFLLVTAIVHALVDRRRPAWRGVAAIAGAIAIAGLLVWAYFSVHVSHWTPRRQHQNTLEMVESTIGDGAVARTILAASDEPFLRPLAQYAAGVMHVAKRTAGRNPVFFRGTLRPSATSLYFPTLYLLKEPLAWWLAVCGLALSIVVLRADVRFDAQRLRRRFEEVAMALWILVYWGMCLGSGLNLGIRHLLPTYPFAALLTAAAAAFVLRRRSRAAWALGVWATLYVASTLLMHPSYLAFYNVLAGGPGGGRHVAVDSNLDWGQDLRRLGRWLIERGVARIEVDYFGGGDIAYDLQGRGFERRAHAWPEIHHETEAAFLARNESDGWIAVSATRLQTALGGDEPGRYTWLVRRTPETVIGHSIFVWRVTAEPDR